MKFVLAPDSFKESMTAKEVCESMEYGIRKVFPDADIVHVPMADGGEGTVQALVDATVGTIAEMMVTGPLGSQVQAVYGILGDGTTAVIEMASASGIQYVNKETKNPLITTTYGTGELIKECLDRGCKKIILGIGGSATNDGGSGMARALGALFLDEDGNEIPQGGGYLSQLSKIDITQMHPKLAECMIEIASDVTNVLCGKEGASAVFGPQKGATPEMVSTLDRNLEHYANIVRRDIGRDILCAAGGGAAGGLGAGLIAFTNCKMSKGIDIVIRYSNLKEKLQGADYCFTGEGQIDFQTKFGKTPYGVMKAAKEVDPDIKVVAVAGCLGKDIESLYEEGFTSIFGIIPTASDIETLLKTGKENIARTCESICRLIKDSAAGR
ncbi:glycerate kinase family protein [Anaerobium acetethylicum]|uniref:Glycerate kinase n=1 Tax=Anaerobium acetethylicum TaxID=1619234 RepID=A0A1D3TPY6_9FIRM|nr:glycerate kinase [Anaerobium acetethylicum]SCP95559.1 glycerate kinase [Anaerobium acetethylicum]